MSRGTDRPGRATPAPPPAPPKRRRQGTPNSKPAGPSWRDYAASAGTVYRGGSGRNALSVYGSGAKSLIDYAQNTTPGEAWDTTKTIAQVLPGVLADELTNNTGEFIAGFIPGYEVYNAVRDGAQLRSEGKAREASELELQAMPLEYLNFLPVGALAKVGKAGTKASLRGLKNLAVKPANKALGGLAVKKRKR
tara:strand:+ start:163 stop:741 length:579 start_codon:yes stop_codon:yes gene_type:complete